MVWPTKSGLADVSTWETNIAFVKLLFEAGAEVAKWVEHEDPKYPYQKFPYHFKFGNVEIEFLPHWIGPSIGFIGTTTHQKTQFQVLKSVVDIRRMVRFFADNEGDVSDLLLQK